MVPPRLKLVTPENMSEITRPDGGDAEAEALKAAIEEAEANGASIAVPRSARDDALRALEALLFAAPEPVDEATLQSEVQWSDPVRGLLIELQDTYRDRGIMLVEVAGKWMFRTATDLAGVLAKHRVEERKLSRAALETLAIIAYHQPVTRAEIEDIRGVATSAGTLDILMEAGWVRPRGRRRAPGKPLTYGTTDSFLAHFGLKTVKDLPGLQDLKAQGLLDGHLPPGFAVPDPRDVASLMPDELPLEAQDPAREEDAEASEDEDRLEQDGTSATSDEQI